MTLETFIGLPPEADIDHLITEQKRTVQAVREAATIKARAQLSEFRVPQLPEGLTDLLARSLDDIGKDSERIVEQHLKAHEMPADGASWIADGIEYATGDNCPFCGQDIAGLPLIAAYRAIFSDGYNALVGDIAAGLRALDESFGEAAVARLDTLAEQNKAAVEFWRQYCTLDAATIAYPADMATALRAVGQAARSPLESKQRTPLEVVPPVPAFATAIEEYGGARSQLQALNASIRAANAIIAAKKTETGAADLKSAESELTRLKATKIRHSEEVAPLCTGHSDYVAEKEDLERRKAAVRKQLDAHTKNVVEPYERRINELLDVFNAGFTIAETTHSYPGGIATSSYQLVINQRAIEIGDAKTPADKPSFKNTLSAGTGQHSRWRFSLPTLNETPHSQPRPLCSTTLSTARIRSGGARPSMKS